MLLRFCSDEQSCSSRKNNSIELTTNPKGKKSRSDRTSGMAGEANVKQQNMFETKRVCWVRYRRSGQQCLSVRGAGFSIMRQRKILPLLECDDPFPLLLASPTRAHLFLDRIISCADSLQRQQKSIMYLHKERLKSSYTVLRVLTYLWLQYGVLSTRSYF